jgi:Protein of unknown function (DUF2845)
MRSTGIFLLFLALAWALPGPEVLAASLSCESGIISTGDRSIDVLAKCGAPDSKESHQEELGERLDDNTRQKTFITVEEWTYNFGPTKFMRIVVLKNGVVVNIRLGNYGYSKQTEPVQRECTEQLVSVGDSKTDVLARCGEPSLKDSHAEETREKLGDMERKVFATVEEWTYNLGPTRFVRILTFRNSRLTDIRTGNYGY